MAVKPAVVNAGRVCVVLWLHISEDYSVLLVQEMEETPPLGFQVVLFLADVLPESKYSHLWLCWKTTKHFILPQCSHQ